MTSCFIQAADIRKVRKQMRRAGCTYDAARGWFNADGSPTAIHYSQADGWYAVVRPVNP